MQLSCVFQHAAFTTYRMDGSEEKLPALLIITWLSELNCTDSKTEYQLNLGLTLNDIYCCSFLDSSLLPI